MSFYVYIHRRATDGRVFYVGKGTGRRAASVSHRNKHWHATRDKHGMSVEIAAKWPSEADAFEHERLLIACFRDLGHPLVNITDGGGGLAGLHFSDEHKARIAAGRKGHRHTEETRARMSELARQRLAERPGLKDSFVATLKASKLSEQGRQKLSEAARGRILGPTPEATKAKLSKAMTGRKLGPRSDDIKARISAGRKGKGLGPLSEETRARMSAAQSGRPRGPMSEETKARISATKRAKALQPPA